MSTTGRPIGVGPIGVGPIGPVEGGEITAPSYDVTSTDILQKPVDYALAGQQGTPGRVGKLSSSMSPLMRSIFRE